jgi:aconitate hydratase
VGNRGHAVIAGVNYGQGSSREHAAIGPRSLGLRLVLARSFARIHRQNLINYGVLPLWFELPADYDGLRSGDVLIARDLTNALQGGGPVRLLISGRNNHPIMARHGLTAREAAIIQAGGLISWWFDQLAPQVPGMIPITRLGGNPHKPG